MRDLKIGNQANGKGKKVGGCKDGYKKKYNRELGRYTCEKIEKKRNPRQDGVLPKEELKAAGGRQLVAHPEHLVERNKKGKVKKLK